MDKNTTDVATLNTEDCKIRLENESSFDETFGHKFIPDNEQGNTVMIMMITAF